MKIKISKQRSPNTPLARPVPEPVAPISLPVPDSVAACAEVSPSSLTEPVSSMAERYSIADLAEALKVSQKTIRRLIKAKGIPVERVGSQIRIREAQVGLFLKV